MSWFKRTDKNISTKTEEKKDIPAGLWYKTPSGKIIDTKELSENLYVSPEDDYHVHIGSKEYFEILFDNNYKELNANMVSVDFLKFKDQKKYSDRLKEAQANTSLKDAIRIGFGKSFGKNIVIACMDFKFIGGSMGSVVGEKISLSISYAIKYKCPLVIISKSGGARMMESATSLMQMAKTSAALKRNDDMGGLFISVMTHPTTGGVAASFASLGDYHIAEMSSLIGFAGPRVIKQTIREELPEGFQTAEFQQQSGQVDIVLHRQDIRKTLFQLLKFHQKVLYDSL